VFRRCRLGEFTTSKGKSWGVSCNESPQYCAEQRANCKEEEDVCLTQLTACEKEIPVCQDKQKPCVWKTFAFLGKLLRAISQLNCMAGTGCENSIKGLCGKLTNALGSSAMNGDPYNDEKYTASMHLLLKELVKDEYSWGKRLSLKFFDDPSGARQGMWVFLHSFAEHAPELIKLLYPTGNYEFQEFWDQLMLLTNPCPTCRKRYKADIQHLQTESKSTLKRQTLQSKTLQRASTLGQDWDQFRLNVWMYHNEVSQRVQTGMRQDQQKISGVIPPDQENSVRESREMLTI